MSSSPPDAFTVRDAGVADLEAAAELVRAEEQVLRGESTFGAGDLSDFWFWAGFDGGSWVLERDGEMAAFAACIYREDRTECWATVHPDYVGLGLGAFLLARAEERARELRKPVLTAGRLAENERAESLLEALRFREARHFFQMRIAFDGPPEAPQWPDGVEPATFRREDARDFHRTLNEAFAEEWGFHSLSFDEWSKRRLEAPDNDTSLWFIARAGDDVAGVVRCDAHRDGGGWIGALGVAKPWRRRGIGLALLRHAFAEFHRRGEPHVGLGVDAQNPTGATRLYERAGMRVLKEDVIYEKKLA
jgi:mycothiol synthase